MINHFKSINKKSSKEALESIILTDVTSHTYFEKKNFNNTSKNLKNHENANINILKNIKI